MTLIQATQLSPESLAAEFFEQSVGWWQSFRRYYTLRQEGEPEEVVSLLELRHLEYGCSELLELAALHQLDESQRFHCGTYVTWESNYVRQTRKPTKGSTIFGVLGNKLYRDRGFATSKPVTALYTPPPSLPLTLFLALQLIPCPL